MAKKRIPIIGEPVFTLSQHNWSDKIKITTGLSYLNVLAYISVDAVKCMSVGYTDDTMARIIINKDYKNEKNEDVSITIDAEENGKRKTSVDCFVEENEANAVAAEMNKQFKEECKTILDAVGQMYHEYDNINAALKGAKK